MAKTAYLGNTVYRCGVDENIWATGMIGIPMNQNHRNYLGAPLHSLDPGHKLPLGVFGEK